MGNGRRVGYISVYSCALFLAEHRRTLEGFMGPMLQACLQATVCAICSKMFVSNSKVSTNIVFCFALNDIATTGLACGAAIVAARRLPYRCQTGPVVFASQGRGHRGSRSSVAPGKHDRWWSGGAWHCDAAREIRDDGGFIRCQGGGDREGPGGRIGA